MPLPDPLRWPAAVRSHAAMCERHPGEVVGCAREIRDFRHVCCAVGAPLDSSHTNHAYANTTARQVLLRLVQAR